MIRQLFISLFTALVLVNPFAVSHAAQAANLQTVVLDVPGMTCRFCPITVRKALQKVPGVVEARSDFDSKTATVTFDPARTTVQDLTTAVKNAGYEAIPRKTGTRDEGRGTGEKP